MEREKVKHLVRRMRIALNEIQPAVSVVGLEVESNTIRAMKEDLEGLEQCLAAAEATKGFRLDTASQAVSLQDMLAKHGDPAEMSDGDLRVTLLAAETFLVRGYEYLSVKQSYLEEIGGVHATA